MGAGRGFLDKNPFVDPLRPGEGDCLDLAPGIIYPGPKVIDFFFGLVIAFLTGLFKLSATTSPIGWVAVFVIG